MQTSGSFSGLIALFFFSFPPALTVNQVALPQDHLTQLIPHMKTTLQSSSFPSPLAPASPRDAGGLGGDVWVSPPPVPPVLPALPRCCRQKPPSSHIQLRSSAPLQPFSQGRTGIKRKQIKPNGLIAIIFPCLFAVPCGSLRRRRKKKKGNALYARVALLLVTFPARELPRPGKKK